MQLRHAQPEGYRKALRLMRQAEKFRRPIITFIDTSGAYPAWRPRHGPGRGHRPEPDGDEPSHRAGGGRHHRGGQQRRIDIRIGALATGC